MRKILAEPGLENAGARLWPKLKNITCNSFRVHKGAKMSLKKYFGDISHSNGWVLSHAGVFGEAIEDTDLYKLVTGTCFYEFMEKGKKAKRPVFENDLEVGKVYTIIVTTPSGLYRFNTEISIRIAEIREDMTIFTVE